MPKHKLMVRETSKFIVEIEAPTEKEAQEIFENNIKDSLYLLSAKMF